MPLRFTFEKEKSFERGKKSTKRKTKKKSIVYMVVIFKAARGIAIILTDTWVRREEKKGEKKDKRGEKRKHMDRQNDLLSRAYGTWNRSLACVGAGVVCVCVCVCRRFIRWLGKNDR